MLPVLVLGLVWGAGQPLAAGGDKPSFWQTLESKLPGKGAKETPAEPSKAVMKELLGTWVGKQDGMEQAVFTLILRKDNTFEFTTRMSPEALKQMPKDAAKPVLDSQKGTYKIDGNLLSMNGKGEASNDKTWKLDGNTLVLDKVLRMKKTK